jgi:GTP cyclohydrolase I
MTQTSSSAAALALGADIDSPGLQDTPRRVADAYAELPTPPPLHGLIRDDPRTRQEFLALTTRTSHEH